MTDSERLMRETVTANQRREAQIEEATGEQEDGDALGRIDEAYASFIRPTWLSEADEMSRAQEIANDQDQRQDEPDL